MVILDGTLVPQHLQKLGLCLLYAGTLEAPAKAPVQGLVRFISLPTKVADLHVEVIKFNKHVAYTDQSTQPFSP